MDDSIVQQTESVSKDNCATAGADGNQPGITLPPPERNSDNDASHEAEGFQAFVLGYN